MTEYRPSRFSSIPPVVKNILILNLLAYIILNVGYFLGEDLTLDYGLFYVKSDYFRPVQFVTHMFLHAPVFSQISILHILSNMFALWMFGSNLEQLWGPKRFLFFYFFTGLGASAVHAVVTYLQVQHLEATGGNPELLYSLINTPTIGASGAVFGILAAFGLTFPNVSLMFILLPIPIKAKYFVLLYALFELYSGIQSLQGAEGGISIAHFAHLGGAIFGFILVKYWSMRGRNFR